jgi:hypothetical protein
MNVLGGDDFFRVLNVQVEFLRSTVGKWRGRMWDR